MIKLATKQDTRQLFHWRNLDEAIELSLLKRKVDWNEHLEWFNSQVLPQDKILLFIIQPNAGTIRCDLEDNNVTLSIYLNPKYRGKGIGIVALNQAIREVLDKWEVHKFIAYIRENNLASIKLFSKLGFIRVSTRDQVVRMESL